MTKGQRPFGGARLAVLGLLVVGLVAGCNRGSEPEQAATETTQKEPDKPAVEMDPRWHQALADATRGEPPVDWPALPERTLTGKSVGKLYTEFTKAWDGVRLVSDEGKRIVYTASLDTAEGPIEIALRPDWAPNHVRNFVALARVGYYDGLTFHRTVIQKSAVDPTFVAELIEGGCPLGTGELGCGSIGHWLKPEFNPDVKHEEGTVGAPHGEEADTACCKFYLTLCKIPQFDGNYTVFGKVTKGLDVARKILAMPAQESEESEGDGRPLKPVVIRKVNIATKEVDKKGPGGEN